MSREIEIAQGARVSGAASDRCAFALPGGARKVRALSHLGFPEVPIESLDES